MCNIEHVSQELPVNVILVASVKHGLNYLKHNEPETIAVGEMTHYVYSTSLKEKVSFGEQNNGA